MEVAFPNPKVYILRDIISEPEMARLKELAEPKVGRHGNDRSYDLSLGNFRYTKRRALPPNTRGHDYATRGEVYCVLLILHDLWC